MGIVLFPKVVANPPAFCDVPISIPKVTSLVVLAHSETLILPGAIQVGLVAVDGTGGGALVDAGIPAIDTQPAIATIDSGVGADADPRPCTLYYWVVNVDHPNGILVCATHDPWQPCNGSLPCTTRLDAGASTDVPVNPDLADLCGPLAVTVTVLDSGIHMCGPLPLDAGAIDTVR
jgi:hypothetical protein